MAPSRLVAALILVALPVAAQSIQVVDATEKIYQADATLPSPSASATLTAAQNEFEAFQIVVKGPATNVSLTAHALTGPGGAQIAPSTAGHQGNIMVYREVFFSLPGSGKPTDPSAKEGNVPDALVPQYDEFYQEARNAGVTSVAAGQNVVFFVDIQVPQAAAPGVYSGSVTVNYNGTTAAVPVSLTVWPFALPSTPHLKTFIPFEWDAATLQYPSLSGKTLATVGQMHLLHAMEGVNNRVTIHAFDDGDGSLADYNTTFGALINGTANTLLPGAHPTVLRYLGAHGTGNTLAAWHTFFSQHGWLDYLVDYVADEPAGGKNSTWCSMMTNAAADVVAGVRSMVTTSIEQARIAKCSTSGAAVNLANLSIFIPTVDQIQPNAMTTGHSTVADYSSWRAGTRNGKSNEIWEYQSCDSWGCSPPGSATGWPSRALDHSAIRARALEWISFRNGITGEFYWGSTVAWTGLTQKPWTNQYSNGGNGDGTMLYPGVAANAQVGGTHDIPLGSLRLKMLREGVEDYEYLYLLSSLGDAAYGDAQIDSVFATAHSASTATPVALYAARKNLACRIIGDQHPGWTCDPATWTTTAVAAAPCNSTDCFNRADSAGLGPNWTSRAGLFQLVSNNATNTAANSLNVSTWTAAAGPDQDVSVDCEAFDAASNCGLTARWFDSNNFYTAILSPSAGAVQLIKTQAGVATQLGTATRAVSSGTAYHLRVVVQGSALSVYFNNETVPTITAVDTGLTAGNYCGISGTADGAQAVWFANFNLNAIAYSASVAKSGAGSGTVTSNNGLSCGATCSVPSTIGAAVTLTAAAASGSTFTGFSGACTSASSTCAFTVSGDSVVNAAFTLNSAFSLAVSPASGTVAQGGSAAFAVATAVTGGAAQTVALSVSGLPTGATAAFSPASVTAGGGSTLTVTTGAATPAGTYPLTITGTGASGAKTAAASLTVTAVGGIAFRAMSTYVSLSASTKNIALTVPAAVHAGDALIANVFIGDYLTVATAPAITAPAGWTLVKSVKQGAAGVLSIYSKVAVATDPGKSYSWTTTVWVGAASTMLAYSGTNATAPVDASAVLDNAAAASTYSTPAVTTTAAGDQVIAVYAGYSLRASWSAPAGTTRRVNLNNGGLLAISASDLARPAAGASGTLAATGTPSLSYGLTALIALKR